MTETSQFSIESLAQLRGKPVYSSDQEQIGKVDVIYVDYETRVPEWIGIGTGVFRSRRLLVPTQGAMAQDDGVHVAFDKDRVESSPDVDDDAIPEETERSLYDHYGISYSDERSASTLPGSGQRARATGSDQPSMKRSEEELHVGKRETEAGRVRLHKWVETEPVTEDVTLRRETAKVERTPVDEPATSGEISEEDVEVTLSKEEPVVEKRTVAKERVSVQKGEDTTTEQVSDQIRKEVVEVDGEDVERIDR
jgi:uncharacterized protein (TIGR02271 family)